MYPLEFKYPYIRLDTNSINNIEAVVVLAGGASRAIHQDYILFRASSIRVLEAFKLYKRFNNLKFIVSGGCSGSNKHHLSEGQLMANTLEDMGMPKENIMVEGESRNTIENASFTASILKKLNIKNTALITSAFHMPRSLLAFNKVNIKPLPLPCDYMVNSLSYNSIDYIPQLDSFSESSVAVHEYLGILSYHIFF
ncbi:MAG: YdcF family protein [bacterium]